MSEIKITTADKTLRELQLIEFLFQLQFSDKYDDNPYLTIIDGESQRINGRFIGSFFMIYSQVELFNIQEFKREFTTRYENARDNTLLVNQAKEIKDNASGIVQFVTENWNEDNYKVQEFIAWEYLGAKNPNIYSLIDALGLVSATTGERLLIQVN